MYTIRSVTRFFSSVYTDYQTKPFPHSDCIDLLIQGIRNLNQIRDYEGLRFRSILQDLEKEFSDDIALYEESTHIFQIEGIIPHIYYKRQKGYSVLVPLLPLNFRDHFRPSRPK